MIRVPVTEVALGAYAKAHEPQVQEISFTMPDEIGNRRWPLPFPMTGVVEVRVTRDGQTTTVPYSFVSRPDRSVMLNIDRALQPNDVVTFRWIEQLA